MCVFLILMCVFLILMCVFLILMCVFLFFFQKPAIRFGSGGFNLTIKGEGEALCSHQGPWMVKLHGIVLFSFSFSFFLFLSFSPILKVHLGMV
jgi:hypothetical protein